MDLTPSVLEAHMNEGILFVECGRGLNSEKIALLEYRIAELLKLYSVEVPKILMMVSDIALKEPDRPKLKALLDLLIRFTRGRVRWIKILTQNTQIADYLQSSWEYGEIGIFGSIDKAMDELMGKKNEAGAPLKLLTGHSLSHANGKRFWTPGFQGTAPGPGPLCQNCGGG